MEEAGWTAWIAGEGYDELWAHEELNGDGMPEVLVNMLGRWNLLEGKGSSSQGQTSLVIRLISIKVMILLNGLLELIL